MERNILYVILGLVVSMSIIIAAFFQPTSKPGETSTPGSTPTSTAQQPTSPQNTTTTMRHPFYPDRYSRYGGWLGLRVEGTGFFRVAVVNGKYWLVDPDGYVFISKGVNHVDYMGDFSPSLGYSPYYVNVLRKYGSASKWVETTMDRLMKWGFNTIGAWSSRELYKYMPYTINLNILGNYGFNWTTGRMPDVFSDGFVESVENNAYFNCQPLAEDPLLIGYFLDNELHWGPDWRSNTHLLDEFFKLSSNAPGKKVAVEVVKEAYGGDISKLNNEWGTSFTSFYDLLTYSGQLPDTNTVGNARLDFVRKYAERYFSVAVSAIKKYDPNHLILGIRFAGLPSKPYELEVLKVMAKYVDVVTINLYNTISPPKDDLARLHELTGKPLIITEFSFRARDSGLPNTKGAGLTFDTQSERANATRQFVSELISLDFVIGYHWFQYYDQPKEGRFDGENSNYGLVRIDDEPYTEMIEMFTNLNNIVEEIHMGLK